MCTFYGKYLQMFLSVPFPKVLLLRITVPDVLRLVSVPFGTLEAE